MRFVLINPKTDHLIRRGLAVAGIVAVGLGATAAPALGMHARHAHNQQGGK